MDADPQSPDAAAVPLPGLTEPHVHLMRMQEAFEFATDAQFVADRRGLILEANHTAADLLRCSKEFLVHKPLGLFVTDSHRRRFYSSLLHLARGGSIDTFTSQVVRRGDGVRDINVLVTEDRRGMRSGLGPDALRFHWRFTDVTAQKRAEAARDELLRRLVTAQEDERRRVSRELHDTIGQLLTALSLAVRAAQEGPPLPEETSARLDTVRHLAEELSRSAHDLAVRLRPTALDDVGVGPALSQYVAEWSARTKVEVDYYDAFTGRAERAPAEIETAVYRIVQEAMTNVARHAAARRVSVVITRHEGQMTVAVEDDGIGFDPDMIGPGRPGLIGMQERAALAHGEVEIESSPGHGTTVLARFPLAPGQEAEAGDDWRPPEDRGWTHGRREGPSDG